MVVDTNSILRNFPIPAATRCRVLIEGLALPFSSLLISPWAIPVRCESSFCVSPESRLASMIAWIIARSG